MGNLFYLQMLDLHCCGSHWHHIPYVTQTPKYDYKLQHITLDTSRLIIQTGGLAYTLIIQNNRDITNPKQLITEHKKHYPYPAESYDSQSGKIGGIFLQHASQRGIHYSTKVFSSTCINWSTKSLDRWRQFASESRPRPMTVRILSDWHSLTDQPAVIRWSSQSRISS